VKKFCRKNGDFDSMSSLVPFSFALALKAVYLSFASYCDSDVLLAWSCLWCSKLPKATNTTAVADAGWTSVTGGYGYVAFFDDSAADADLKNTIVVSFRGSADVQNWLRNLDATQTWPYEENPNIAVHAGFYAVFQSIEQSIRAGVLDALAQCPTCDKLLCTGHSLGAAIAGLCAFEYSDVFRGSHAGPRRLNVSMINFGMPRLGNRAFSRHFAKRPLHRVWRNVHANDIVPHVPLQYQFPYFDSFEHVSTQYWWPDDNVTDFRECNGPEDPTCSDSVPLWETSIEDHETYLGVTKISCSDN
jgi:predicted lipase